MVFFSYCDWLVLLGTLLVVGYIYSTWTFGHWKKIGVPYLKNPLPMFGHMGGLVLGKSSFKGFYLDMYQQFKGSPFGGFYKFRDPALMVCEPELVKNIMSSDFASFHDNDFDVSEDIDPMVSKNPFSLKGEKWKIMRHQLTPAFTPSKIKPLFPLINEVCEDLVQYLEKNSNNADGVESKEVASRFTTDVVTTCAYGLRGNSFAEEKPIFREMGRDVMTSGNWWRNFQVQMILVAPKFAKFFRFRFFDEAITNFFRGVIKDAINHREKNNVTRNDFLQLLMQLKSKGQVDGSNTDMQLQKKFTDDDIAASALTFFSDGFETSSIVMSLSLYEVAKNPEIQKKLRAEVDRVVDKHGGKLTYDMLQEVPYLEMVISETMRLYPAAPALTRLCTKPYDLPTPNGDRYQVQVGTCVVLPVVGFHMDPQYFPDPQRFDPERFNEENKRTRHSYSYLPFGGGPRLCIGNRFAMTQIGAGIVSVIANFEMQLAPRSAKSLVFNPKMFMPTTKDGIWIKFTKRNNKYK